MGPCSAYPSKSLCVWDSPPTAPKAWVISPPSVPIPHLSEPAYEQDARPAPPTPVWSQARPHPHPLDLLIVGCEAGHHSVCDVHLCRLFVCACMCMCVWCACVWAFVCVCVCLFGPVCPNAASSQIIHRAWEKNRRSINVETPWTPLRLRSFSHPIAPSPFPLCPSCSNVWDATGLSYFVFPVCPCVDGRYSYPPLPSPVLTAAQHHIGAPGRWSSQKHPILGGPSPSVLVSLAEAAVNSALSAGVLSPACAPIPRP